MKRLTNEEIHENIDMKYYDLPIKPTLHIFFMLISLLFWIGYLQMHSEECYTCLDLKLQNFSSLTCKLERHSLQILVFGCCDT